MAFALAGSTPSAPSTATITTALSLTFSLTGCVAGNGIIFGVSSSNKDVTTVTLTGESNATLLPQTQATGTNGQAKIILGYFKNLSGSGSKTLTINFDGAGSDAQAWCMEVSGGDTTNFLDQNASAHLETTGTSAAPSQTLTTNSQNCLIVTHVAGGTGSAPTATAAGYTNVGAGWYVTFRSNGAYRLDAGATNAPAPAWVLGSSDTWPMVSAAFAPASGGGSSIAPLAAYHLMQQ
jgi:hypothetical protein